MRNGSQRKKIPSNPCMGTFRKFLFIFYSGTAPLATVELQDCTADSSSNIQLLKGFVCEGDHIMVDGEPCTILSLTLD